MRVANLVFEFAAQGSYEHLVLCEPGTLVPGGLVEALRAALAPDVAVVTPWTSGRGPTGLANSHPDANLGEAGDVQRVSDVLDRHFGVRSVPSRAIASPCLLFPITAVREAGKFDPLFETIRGAQIDWITRARHTGRSATLAPGVVVHHQDGAHADVSDNPGPALVLVGVDGGVLTLRHGDDQGPVDGAPSAEVSAARAEATEALVVGRAREQGYVVEVSWISSVRDAPDDPVAFVVTPDVAHGSIEAAWGGFVARWPIGAADAALASVCGIVGAPPRGVIIRERGERAAAVMREAEQLGISADDSYDYPQQVAPDRISAPRR